MIELLTVGLLAALDLWLALPAAFALPIPPPVAAIVMAIGGTLGAYVAALATEQIRRFVEKHYSGYGRMVEKTQAAMDKYGIHGIGLTAPVILGPLLTTVMAIVLGASRGKLMLWITLGNILWCFLFYLAFIFGDML